MLHFLSWLLLQITKCFRTGGPVFQQIFLRLKQDVVFVPFDYQPETGYLSLYSIQQLLWLTYISGEGNGYPLQYSCLENPMDGGAWRATVHGAARVGHDLPTKAPPLHAPKFCFMCKSNWMAIIHMFILGKKQANKPHKKGFRQDISVHKNGGRMVLKQEYYIC